MIAALFVDPRGAYAGLSGVDPWPQSRDARTYAGPWPVVAHPPCGAWSRLAGLREAVHGLKRGEDGGCFAAALEAVRRWGGVLEHPAYSDAWQAFNLPPPAAAGWQATVCGGWVCQVDQSHYGHPARKRTWLYAHGMKNLPALRWGAGAPVALVSSDNYLRRATTPAGEWRRRLGKRAASATPPAFRDVLLGIAMRAGRDAVPCGGLCGDVVTGPETLCWRCRADVPATGMA